MKWFSLLLLILDSACTDVPVKEVTIQAKDSAKATSSSATQVLPVRNKSKPNPFLGAWSEGPIEHATFSIGIDSIFYVEDNDSMPYHITGDSIVIRFPGYTYKALISLQQDTLLMTDDYGDAKFWRFRR